MLVAPLIRPIAKISENNLSLKYGETRNNFAQLWVKNGVHLGEMNMLLLKKIEELTLYIINQQKEIDELKQTYKK